jgi:hypothetical protein
MSAVFRALADATVGDWWTERRKSPREQRLAVRR